MTACEGKRKYYSRNLARKIMISQERSDKGPARVYKCDICHAWHITSDRYGKINKLRRRKSYEK